MTNLITPIRRWLKPIHPLAPGMYHYQSPAADPRNYRLHLRLEVDGSGLLILNAATVLHLNQTAAEYAYYLVKNWHADRVAEEMSYRYKVERAQAKEDYQTLVDRIQTLVNSPDLDPVTFLDIERRAPFSGSLSAPYRLDCALTYRVSPGEAGTPLQVAPVERVKNELNTTEWMHIMDKAWDVGVPHIVFTGGEPTLRQDLVQLIAHGEANGQVTGLISDGLRLADKAYLDELLQTGLDHLMIVLQPQNPATWKALENALVDDLFVAVHLTLDQNNFAQLNVLLKNLASSGVKAISVSAVSKDLAVQLEALRQAIAQADLELVWNLPVPYSGLHPVALETGGVETPAGAGSAFLYIEPDGDVLPAQGINRVLGNFLSEDWDAIHRRGI